MSCRGRFKSLFLIMYAVFLRKKDVSMRSVSHPKVKEKNLTPIFLQDMRFRETRAGQTE